MSLSNRALRLLGLQQHRERVVILGSGWAGYTIARELDPRKYQAVIVSPRSYFAFTPLLASTSVGTLEFRTALEPVRTKRNGLSFFQGWADAVDFKNKKVTIEESVHCPSTSKALTQARHAEGNVDCAVEVKRRKDKKTAAQKGKMFDLTYDKLIVTVGCYSQTFNTPGIKEHALFLKDVGDARRIRSRLLSCFESAALPTASEDQKRQILSFAVVGGGPTGIEFSAELHDIIHEDLARIYPQLIPYHKITVYDVATKVLPMFDEKLAKYATDKFKREGIEIKMRHHVEGLKPGAPGVTNGESSIDNAIFSLKIKDQSEIGVGMVVWSTGLMQNPFVANALSDVHTLPHSFQGLVPQPSPSSPSVPSFSPNLQTTTDPNTLRWKVKQDAKTGSVITDSRLRVKLVSSSSEASEALVKDVYALGDCAIVEGTNYPATAQVASQKAVWLARRLNDRKNLDDAREKGFTWHNMGTLAYIGNWHALLQGSGSGGGMSGRLAWLVWRGAYLTKSVSWRNRILIPTYWTINWMFGRDISRF